MTTAGWFRGYLGDVVTFQRGYDITKREQREGPYPVISSSGPAMGHDAFKVEGPGVVIGRKGSLGGVYYSESPYWPHDTTLWVRDFHGNSPHFIYYFLQTLGLARYDVGASNPTLNRNHLHLLPVCVPSRLIQDRIVSVLSAYDDLIENNTRRIRILEEMAQVIYREWFVEFRFSGHESVRMVDSELGLVPEEWHVGPVSDVLEVSGNLINPLEHPNEEFALYSFAAFDEARAPEREYGEAIQSSKFLITGPSVLYAKLNPRIPRVWLVYPNPNFRALASSEFLVIRARQPWGLTLVYSLLQSGEFVSRAVSMAGGTSTSHQRVRVGDLLSIQVALPPPAICRAFEEAAEPMLTLADRLRQSIQNLAATRDLLLPRLISGEIDVSNLDVGNAEPAA